MTEATEEVKKVVKKPIKNSKKEGDFAVIETGGKQYLVFVGDEVKIEKLVDGSKLGDKITFEKVLLKDTGTATVIGTPHISGAKVTAQVIEIGRSPKIDIVKYKAKTRYFKKIGHRQQFFKIKILSV
ncbi:MAG: 50S ribosomal protein L21 [Candidatus Pacebacteria bacterium]|nr:50S ribosomal protein L21 [Candidatus Paceibacterota bacterium]